MTMLRRYWITFQGDARSLPAGLAMGCGVTAASRREAERIISQELLAGNDLPAVAEVLEGVAT